MKLEFSPSRFVSEFRRLGGQLVLTDQPGNPTVEWFGVISPGRSAPVEVFEISTAMRRELVADRLKEAAVVEVLRAERRRSRLPAIESFGSTSLRTPEPAAA